MNSKRIFAICMFIALLALAATSANAQSQDADRSGWAKYRQSGNPSLEMKAPANTELDKETEASQPQLLDVAPKYRLEGTWRITQSFPDGFSDEGLYSFAAGQDANGGAASFSDQFIFVPNPSCLPAQGVWQRTADKTFIGTHEGFCYDADNGYAPAGKFKFRYSLTLSDTGLTGRLHIDGIDPNGNVVFSADGTLRGVRMRAEAP